MQRSIMANNRGQNQNDMSEKDAGRRDGRAKAQGQGSDFFEEIGRKGGQATAQSHGREFYEDIGRTSGEAQADDDDIRSGDISRQGGRSRDGR
jgi:uncharacterized protein